MPLLFERDRAVMAPGRDTGPYPYPSQEAVKAASPRYAALAAAVAACGARAVLPDASVYPDVPAGTDPAEALLRDVERYPDVYRGFLDQCFRNGEALGGLVAVSAGAYAGDPDARRKAAGDAGLSYRMFCGIEDALCDGLLEHITSRPGVTVYVPEAPPCPVEDALVRIRGMLDGLPDAGGAPPGDQEAAVAAAEAAAAALAEAQLEQADASSVADLERELEGSREEYDRYRDYLSAVERHRGADAAGELPQSGAEPVRPPEGHVHVSAEKAVRKASSRYRLLCRTRDELMRDVMSSPLLYEHADLAVTITMDDVLSGSEPKDLVSALDRLPGPDVVACRARLADDRGKSGIMRRWESAGKAAPGGSRDDWLEARSMRDMSYQEFCWTERQLCEGLAPPGIPDLKWDVRLFLYGIPRPYKVLFAGVSSEAVRTALGKLFRERHKS